MLTDIEIQYARKIIAFNGGTEEEQLRFRALSDEAARAEIAAWRENQLIAVGDELNFVETKRNELLTKKAFLENNV